VHPHAGNIGGGGFMVYRPRCEARRLRTTFREVAPGKSSPTMFLKDGAYSAESINNSHLAVGVPGHGRGPSHGVEEQGKPAVEAPRRAGHRARPRRVRRHRRTSRSLKSVMGTMQKYPSSVAQFTKNGAPYEPVTR